MADRPELDAMSIALPDLGRTIDRWTSYSNDSHFLTPSDGWNFTLGDDRVSDELIDQLRPGLRVAFRVNDTLQGTGYIDRLRTRASRGGTVLTIEGRDVFSPVVDACVDPKALRFKAESSLADILEAVYRSFGFARIDEDADANRNIITGGLRGRPVTRKRKRPVKSFAVHQLKPYPNETAWTFTARLAGRFGLHLWPSADGTACIVGRPTFDQEPAATLLLRKGSAGASNNVIEASCDKSWETQPSVIIATAAGYGGEREWSRLKVAMLNEFAGLDPETGAPRTEVAALLREHADARLLPIRREVFSQRAFVSSPVARPLFLHDDESRTLEQLEYFVRRRMAELQHRAFRYSATVAGHTVGGSPWAVDTLVRVVDEFNRVDETLWLLARTFSKTRSTGTRTALELVRPHTIGLAEVE